MDPKIKILQFDMRNSQHNQKKWIKTVQPIVVFVISWVEFLWIDSWVSFWIDLFEHSLFSSISLSYSYHSSHNLFFISSMAFSASTLKDLYAFLFFPLYWDPGTWQRSFLWKKAASTTASSDPISKRATLMQTPWFCWSDPIPSAKRPSLSIIWESSIQEQRSAPSRPLIVSQQWCMEMNEDESQEMQSSN